MGLDAWGRAEGFLTPLGATWIESAEAYNFALYSTDATAVSLLIYGDADLVNPIKTFAFDFPAHKTARIWHMLVPAAEIAGAKYYAYKVDGPYGPGPWRTLRSRQSSSRPIRPRHFSPAGFQPRVGVRTRPQRRQGAARDPAFQDSRCQPGRVNDRPARHTHDLVIYELHVRNFTRASKRQVDERMRGTYAGVAAMVPYLKDLGVTAVELMPVHQYDPQEGSHWGYMTLGFFAPHHAYAQNSDAESSRCGIQGNGQSSSRSGHRSDPGRGLQPHHRGRSERPDL